MIYSFGAGEIDGTTMKRKVELYERLAAACGKELMTTVYPGYYGAWLNGRNDFYQVHCGFDPGPSLVRGGEYAEGEVPALHDLERPRRNEPAADGVHSREPADHPRLHGPLQGGEHGYRRTGGGFRLSPRGTARHAAALRSDDAADT